MVHAERGDLAAAREHLRLGHELGDHLGLPKHPHRWRIAEARVREAEGDLAGALTLLDEAERVYDLDFSPDVRPVGRDAGQGLGQAGPARPGARLGGGPRAVGVGRAWLPARVRARHPGAGSPGRRGRLRGAGSSSAC